jgi:hypothetical protein
VGGAAVWRPHPQISLPTDARTGRTQKNISAINLEKVNYDV